MKSFAMTGTVEQCRSRLATMIEGYEYMTAEQYQDDISTIIDILQNDLN